MDSNTGMSFGDILLIIFIVLKLTHVINWSWVWVLSPLWISIIIAVIIVILSRIK